MAERSQQILVWWTLVFMTIYGISLFALLDMIPPPSAELSVNEIAAWYAERHDQVRIGAVICAWTGGFMVPIVIVIGLQMARLERGKVWTLLAIASGVMMTIFFVLPPLFFGVAAFTPTRDPQVTSIMHELGLLSLVTTDQYFIFMWVAVVVICFLPTTARHSPFPRWFAYFSAWVALMFEAGVFAFLARTGPFAWNGVLVYWVPLSVYGLWIGAIAVLLLRNLKAQREENDFEAAADGGRTTPASA
jgi:hypothetical protein